MNILIIEDEAPAARRLQKMILELRPSATIIAHLESIEEAVQWLQANPAPDLAFMDIQLSDGNSFEIFKQVEVTAPVIFTTAYNEYALKAFKVHSVDYLLKPISEEDLRQAIEKFEKLYQNGSSSPLPDIEHLLDTIYPKHKEYKNRFLVRIGDKFLPIPSGDIAYFYTEEKVVFLMTNDRQRYILEHTLDELEQMMDPANFYRLNRQFLARLEAIDRFFASFNGKLKVHLCPEPAGEVIVSRDKASHFKSWMER